MSIYIVDTCRTPLLKARGQPGPFAAADLATQAARALLLKQPFSPELIDETIFGCVVPGPDEANIGRIISLRVGCGEKSPAWTVQRNCASGMQAIDCAAKDIAAGRADLVLAGGTEAMSHAPLLFNQDMVRWFADASRQKGFLQRLRHFSRLRIGYFKPIIGLLRGLHDPLVNLSMGQTAEELAYRFDISREEMDAFSLRSHQRAAQNMQQVRAEEIAPLFTSDGRYYEVDDGIRADTTMETLAGLKPFFDKPSGIVTAGNSSQITDGASVCLVASKKAIQQHGLSVLGKIVDVQWAALDPRQMGLGVVHAVTPLLTRNKLSFHDIDCWELNEAFAGQVLACLAAWRNKKYCQEQLNLDKPFGELDESKLNIDGGAVALGHPIGATGARIVGHALKVLHRLNKRYAIASACIGGGQGGAMLLERVEGV